MRYVNFLRFSLNPFFIAFLICAPLDIHAQGYGIYDARALALGGTTVAIANTNHAQFYNPALLALHDGLEEKTRDGRVYFPMISSQLSDALEQLIEIDSEGLEDDLSTSVNEFNADQSAANANAVLVSSEDLLAAISQVDDQDASLEGFFGLSVVEPSDREGGAFHLGARVIGGGRPDITDADLALLEDYVEALEFVSTSGAQGEAHPELYNPDGTLIDPTPNLTSSATGRGAAMLEFGVSLAHEFTFPEAKIALGFTPKLVVLRTYETLQTVDGNGITTESDNGGFNTFNADIGMAAEITPNLRLGLAVKDLISKRFETELGGSLRIKPKPRVGIGYVRERFQIGLDYDLDHSKPVGTESSIKEVAVGGEWRVIDPLYLRAGYRQDLNKNRDDILSLGLGMEFHKLLFDLTYATGGDGRAAAFQIGYTF